MKHKIFRAFTLVELIVVITILAVLATVAFISFQGYTSSSRDSVRLADLKNISKSFEINRTKGLVFPLPDKKVDISSSGTVFQYQGELSQNILNSHLNIFDGGVDPLTGDNYGYAVNSARNKFQVIGFLENQDSVANISMNTTFADNSDKYVKSSGDNLGILLDETTHEVISDENNTLEIDIATTNESYTLIKPRNQISKQTTGTGYILASEFSDIVYPRADCNALLKNGFATTSGLYEISPDNINTYQVYCDMETDGGGWTLFNGSSAKIGGANYIYNDSNPNFDNYNMSGAILEKILVNKGNKTIRHVIKRDDEDITTDITLNINPQLISLQTGESYLCFNDRRQDVEPSANNYLYDSIAPISQATYNGGKTLYAPKVNDILRVRLHCPNYNANGDNYYSHIKVYKNGLAHHLPWDSFLGDNSNLRYSQYYLQEGYFDIPVENLPTFGGTLQWIHYSVNHKFLNGINTLPEDGNKAILTSPEVPSGLGFEVYMMVR